MERAVEKLMTDVRGERVGIERWDRIKPWSVARARLAGGGGGTVIVKWLRSGVGESRTERWRLSSELAALRFLSEDLGLALAPRVLAADLEAGLLVLEDLAPRVALDHLIRRDGGAAHRERLAAFARALGELGAATAGSANPAPDNRRRFGELWHWAHEVAAFLELPLAGDVAADLADALDELNSPGPFLALSNGDAEANNVLVHEAGPVDARLIDFEAAAYGHALLDVVCLFVPGPQWLCVGGLSSLDEEYRDALARGVPEARDDRLYGFGLAAACASWALLRAQRLAAVDGRPVGDDGRLQLVETLEAAARVADAHRVLPHLAGWFWSAAGVLRRRWPDADVDLTDAARFPPYSLRRR